MGEEIPHVPLLGPEKLMWQLLEKLNVKISEIHLSLCKGFHIQKVSFFQPPPPPIIIPNLNAGSYKKSNIKKMPLSGQQPGSTRWGWLHASLVTEHSIHCCGNGGRSVHNSDHSTQAIS